MLCRPRNSAQGGRAEGIHRRGRAEGIHVGVAWMRRGGKGLYTTLYKHTTVCTMCYTILYHTVLHVGLL